MDNNVDQYSDVYKNGIKTWIFGQFYWDNLHLISYIMNDHARNFRPFVSFYMNSPKDLIPCMTCRKSLKGFLKNYPKHNLDMFIDEKQLPMFMYFLHNSVNCKLDTRIHPSKIMNHIKNKYSQFKNNTMVLKLESKFQLEYIDNHANNENKSLSNDLLNLFKRLENNMDRNIKMYPSDPNLNPNPNLFNKLYYHLNQYNKYDSDQYRYHQNHQKDKWKQKQENEELKQKQKLNNWYEFKFWSWIQSIAFNFPGDIQILDFWSGNNKSSRPYTYSIDSTHGIELSNRLRTYILFFDLLKNIIIRESFLFNKWINAYIMNTPTPMTFSCRTKLVEWINIMQNECHYVPQNIQKPMDMEEIHYLNLNLNHDDDQNMGNMGKTSFAELLQILHPIRSI